MTGPWVDLAVTDAVSLGGTAQVVSGNIITTGAQPYVDYYWPALVMDPASFYQFEITFDPTDPIEGGPFNGGRGVWLGVADPADPVADYDANSYNFDGPYPNSSPGAYPAEPDTGSADIRGFFVGPGRNDWSPVVAGQTVPIFETLPTGAVHAVRYREVTFTTTTGSVFSDSNDSWIPQHDATGFPTVGGTTAKVFIGTDLTAGSASAQLGEPSGVIPDGAIVTVSHIILRATATGDHLAPLVKFNNMSDITANIPAWALVGSGGTVGDDLDGGGTAVLDYDDTYLGVTVTAPGDPLGWYTATLADATGVLVSVQPSTLGSASSGDSIEYDGGPTNPTIRVVWDWLLTVLDEGATALTAPPLRIHPRSDGRGTSTAPRHWPPSPSIQASNRRAGGYL